MYCLESGGSLFLGLCLLNVIVVYSQHVYARVCACVSARVCVCVTCARCSLSDWLADPSGLFGISPGPEGGGQRGERAGSEPEVNWGSPQENLAAIKQSCLSKYLSDGFINFSLGGKRALFILDA